MNNEIHDSDVTNFGFGFGFTVNPIQTSSKQYLFLEATFIRIGVYFGMTCLSIYGLFYALSPDPNQKMFTNITYALQFPALAYFLIPVFLCVFFGDRAYRHATRKKRMEIGVSSRSLRIVQCWPSKYDVTSGLESAQFYVCSLRMSHVGVDYRGFALVAEVDSRRFIVSLSKNRKNIRIPKLFHELGIPVDDRENTVLHCRFIV